MIHDDFSTGSHGWTGGFADYPVGDDSFYDLQWDWRIGPPPNPDPQLYITGNNHSDDLFMYFTKPVTGLAPDTTYAIDFQITFWSMYPTDSVGIGGSPGSGVTLKAGAVPFEPDRIAEEFGWRMNLDKGNQAVGGEDAIVLGHIGTELETFTWTQITRASDGQLFQADTDAAGTLWLLFGTDSGFEGITDLYYSTFDATLTPITPLPGDLDGNGFVGIEDLNIVLGSWNQTVPPGDPLADPSGDGFVGIEDLNTVLGNWNAGAPPPGNAIPEPASALALLCGVCLALMMSRPSGGHAQFIRVS